MCYPGVQLTWFIMGVWYVCVCKNAVFRVSGEGNILLGYVHCV